MLELRGISKHFSQRVDWAQRAVNVLLPPRRRAHDRVVRAVDGVDLVVAPGEVVGLVGESGCGKSTLGRLAAGLLAPTAGQRFWEDVDVATMPNSTRQKLPLSIQMIFQDPYSSLNPRRTVEDLVGEAPVVHGLIPAAQKRDYRSGTIYL